MLTARGKTADNTFKTVQISIFQLLDASLLLDNPECSPEICDEHFALSTPSGFLSRVWPE